METEQPLLSVDLRVDYPNKPRTLSRVCFEMRRGEILGLVGESGSGKSTVALSILNLLSFQQGRAKGHVLFRGREILTACEPEMRRVRGRDIALVLQSPQASLNPALRIGTQVAEAWRAHARGSSTDQQAAVALALAGVGLPHDREFCHRYSSQISVGQAQRVLIAMAVMHRPALLVADEPTSALDVITQAEIMQLLSQLNRSMGMAILYISHDLVSVASICHRIAILHGGEIVECGSRDEVVHHARHPYTRKLLACVPWLEKDAMRQDLKDTEGTTRIPIIQPEASMAGMRGREAISRPLPIAAALS
ncbi:MAG TPA: ABC transporter ATP-binding protein [Terriglobales bacterium]|nr:ABC transporter ATP-binding protein [Terriglobales bacterium]